MIPGHRAHHDRAGLSFALICARSSKEGKNASASFNIRRTQGCNLPIRWERSRNQASHNLRNSEIRAQISH